MNQRTEKIKEKIKEFIAELDFLRQRFEVVKTIKGNHSIIFQSRVTTSKIILHFSPKLIPFDQLLQILDQLTSDEADRRASNMEVTL